MKKLQIIFVVLIVLIGCTKNNNNSVKHEVKVVKGVKIHTNKNIASVDKLDMNFKEKFVLDGNDENNKEANFALFPGTPVLKDKLGNYYLIDKKESKVKKFDKTGKFITAFGGKGNGPGEFQMAQSFVILEDSVYITDAMTQSVVKFTTKGVFLRRIRNTIGMPVQMKKLPDGNLIGYIVKPQMKDGKIKIQFNLAVLNSKMDLVKTIVEKSIDFNPAKPMNPTEMITFFTVNKDGYFVAKKSISQFKITNYDFNGVKKAEINKSYMKVPFSKKELEKINATMSKVSKGMGAGVDLKVKSKFKEAINGLFSDKNGYLWVATSQKLADDEVEKSSHKFSFDIFKDGVFLKNLTLPLEKEESETLSFCNDDMITVDYANDKVKVYSY